jgi:glycosyltransferase involved in cell wall biosynthesis
MTILITVSDLRRGGGVAHFYERVAPHLGADARLILVGKRAGEEGPLSGGTRLVRDGVSAWRAMAADERTVLVVNPSLDAKSLGRDGLAVQEARALGRRTIVFVRGWQESTEHLIDVRAGRCIVRPLFAADAFIVLAARFRAALRRWGYRGPVHTATTAVADDVLQVTDAAGIARRCRRRGPIRVLLMSRIRRDKGIVEALEAVRLAQARGVALHVDVAGDGPDLPAAARWVNGHGVRDVWFHGDLRGDGKQRLMAAADVYLFPTTHGEGMPATVLEAMAYGMDVVTCPAGGLEDFFVDGVHGLLVPAPDPAALADRIETLAGDAGLRERLGVAAHEFALRHFTPRRAADRLLAVVNGVSGTRPGVPAPDTDWFVSQAGTPSSPREEAR